MTTRKQTIRINGGEYPSRMTMGAMMEFKERTGREITELQGADLSLALTLLYCCIVSASRADGIPVAFASPMEMADYMDANDFAAWQNDQFSVGSPSAGGEADSAEGSNPQQKKKKG